METLSQFLSERHTDKSEPQTSLPWSRRRGEKNTWGLQPILIDTNILNICSPLYIIWHFTPGLLCALTAARGLELGVGPPAFCEEDPLSYRLLPLSLEASRSAPRALPCSTVLRTSAHVLSPGWKPCFGLAARKDSGPAWLQQKPPQVTRGLLLGKLPCGKQQGQN